MQFDFKQEKKKSFWKKEIPFIWAILGVVVLSVILVFLTKFYAAKIPTKIPTVVIPHRIKKPPAEPIKPRYIPMPFTMETLKKKGCVADGFLSEYAGNTESMVKLINRSECQYLHRALETWLMPPDFDKAEEIMLKIKKPGMVFGMFIAEAIKRNEEYYYPQEDRNFDFSAMCRKGSDNIWGEHTCKPNFEKKEYRKYIRYITQKAMDTGIQSFLFGQVYFQDESDLEKSELPKIIQEMRAYAKELGIQIVVGAQTGYITDDDYLENFDYIEGGVGMDSAGNIEDGPCLSWRSGCWALLWNERFQSRAKNVFLNLDWSGIQSDDMSRFARMDKKTREKTLKNLYQYFTSRNMGFMMPMLAPLYKVNNGCYGPKKRFYSPDNKYLCQDENAIKAIMQGQ
ncbi:MAG: hypothetical protein NTZ97_01340 [Candidatus Moranbacteria bacterium]|nr:hypothetical protein [Candidatus Moranbacteria bacterium]